VAKESHKAKLVRVLSYLDTLYEVGEDCVHPDTKKLVSDPEYDDLLAELRKIDPKNERFTRPSDSKATSAAEKIENDPPLTSISKASHEDLKIQTEQFEKWVKTTNKEDLYISYKLDGVCLRLYYEKGKFVKASTRPRDGIWGDDVSEQVKYISNIPQKLNLPATCSITGELICLDSDFDKVQKQLLAKGEKLRANARNHTAGAIRNFKEPKKVAQMGLTFIGYSVENLTNVDFPDTEFKRAKWVNKDLGIRFVRTTPFKSNKQLQDMEDLVSDLDYMVDGVIVGVNNLEAQEQMGRHGDKATGNPKGKIAWKFRSEKTSVIIKSIDCRTGRSGKITPVACFDGVKLSQTTVTRATMHNYGFVKKHGIRVGTEILITKAGEIIPKVIGVLSGTGKPDIIAACPACKGNAKLVQSSSDKDKWELICASVACPAKFIGRLDHYLSVVGVLGLGEATVELLSKKLRCPADFYKLTVKDAMDCGLSERESLLAVGNIHMIKNPEKMDSDKLQVKINSAVNKKKKISLAKVIAGFGIKNVGESTGKTLVEYFNDFSKIRNASVDELTGIKDVGQTTAESVYKFFKNFPDEADELLKYVLPQLPKTGPLTGKTFCLSGNVDKKILKIKIEDLGGKISGSVGKNTTYLVAGDGSGAKSNKAKELGIKIIDVKKLEKML